MTDYWLSKMFFDLQSPAAAAEYRADREKVVARYNLEPDVKQAVLANDVSYLSKRSNPYLLRYFFSPPG